MEILTDLSLQYFRYYEKFTTTLKSENQHKTDGRPNIKL
jgi:hypothetical protein